LKLLAAASMLPRTESVGAPAGLANRELRNRARWRLLTFWPWKGRANQRTMNGAVFLTPLFGLVVRICQRVANLPTRGRVVFSRGDQQFAFLMRRDLHDGLGSGWLVRVS
jgi:hypothetical protein